MVAVERYWGAQKILYLLGLIKQLGEVKELVDQVRCIEHPLRSPHAIYRIPRHRAWPRRHH